MTRFWKYSKCAGSEKGCSIARKKAVKAVRSIVYDVMDGRAQQHLFTPLGRGRKVIQSSYFETSRWLNEALFTMFSRAEYRGGISRIPLHHANSLNSSYLCIIPIPLFL